MAESKEAQRQQLANDVSERVVKDLANNFAILEARLKTIEMQIAAYAESKKKSVKKAGGTTPTTANGTSEQKNTANGTEAPKAAGSQNALIYFKNQFVAEKKVRDETWKDSYKDEMAKIEKYSKTMAKKKGEEAYKQQADYIWNVVKKTDKEFRTKWQNAAKNGGKTTSSGGEQLKADA